MGTGGKMTQAKYPHEALLDDLHKNFLVYLLCLMIFLGGWLSHYSMFHGVDNNPWSLLQGIVAIFLGVMWIREEMRCRYEAGRSDSDDDE
jgi:NADH:ubiquinone oxidoreductase subunit H